MLITKSPTGTGKFLITLTSQFLLQNIYKMRAVRKAGFVQFRSGCQYKNECHRRFKNFYVGRNVKK